MNIIFALTCVRALLWRDLLVIKQQFPAMLLNLLVSLSVFNLIYGVIGSSIGMDIKNTADIFVGTLVGSLIFVGYSRALVDITDRTFTHCFSYRRSRALSIRWFLATLILSYWLNLFIISVPFLVGGLIFVYWYGVPLIINPLMFITLYSLSMLFISQLFIFLVGSASYGWFRIHVWQRLLTPLGLLGCQFYSWKKAIAVWPRLHYVLVINPMTWANEGIRASLLGTEHYLPVLWSLFGMIIVNIIFAVYITTRMIQDQEWL